MRKLITKFVLAFTFIATAAHGQSIMSENFESLTMPAIPTSWTNVHTGTGLGWVSANHSTFSYAADHTQFVAVYESAGKNTPAILTTNSFSFTGITHPYLNYDVWYAHSYYSSGSADTTEQAYVQLTTDGGSTWHTVDSMGTNGAWETRHVSLLPYAGATAVSLRFIYTDNHGTVNMYGAAIDNIHVFDQAANDLALIALHPDATSATNFVAPGASVNFTGVVENRGYNTITSFQIMYQQGLSPAVTFNATGVSIPPFSTYSFTDTATYTMPATVGSYPFNVWVSLAGDTTVSNDTMTTELVQPSFFPLKTPVFEVATGTWGGWNVRAIVYMDSLQRLHQDSVVIINVHNADSMAYDNILSTHYDNHLGTLITGYPSTIVDRRSVNDPQTAITDYNNAVSTFGYANITSGTVTMIGDSAFIPVSVIPAVDMNGDYRLELVLTEDSVHSTLAGYEQHNYYSYMSLNLPLAETGYNYQTLPNPIPAASMYYSSVARTTVPDMTVSPNGVAGSLPTTMTAGTSYSYTFNNVNMPLNWVSTKVRAAIMLIDNAKGVILNTQKSAYFPLRPGHGTSNVATTGIINDVVLFPNPAADEAKLLVNLNKATTIKIEVYDVTGRITYALSAGEMMQGEHYFSIPVEQFAAGLYQVKVSNSESTVVKTLSVIK